MKTRNTFLIGAVAVAGHHRGHVRRRRRALHSSGLRARPLTRGVDREARRQRRRPESDLGC